MTDAAKTICYCFNYTAGDIRRDAAEHSESTILQRIIEAKQSGKCECAEKHPNGT